MRGARVWLAGLTLALSGPALAADDPVVAVVGTHEIPLSYVHRQVGSVPLAQQIDVRGALERFVDSIVHEEVLFQYGLQRAGESSEWREKLKAAVVRILLGEQMRDRVDIADEDVARYYREEIAAGDHEHIRVSHLSFPDPAGCTQAEGRIASLSDLDALPANTTRTRPSPSVVGMSAI